jgi:hypothetical protein
MSSGPSADHESNGVDPRHHSVAAWDAGRYLNKTRFHLIQAWLLGDRVQCERAIASFDALAAAIREAVPGVEAQLALVRACERERQGWIAQFDSAEHANLLVEANEEFRRLMVTSRSVASALNEISESVLVSIMATYRLLRSEIEAQPHVEHHVLDFGELVDQAIRPPTIINELALEQPSTSFNWEAPPTTDEQQVQRIGWLARCADSSGGRRWNLPTHSLDRTGLLPAPTWFLAVASYWAELQLPGPAPSLADVVETTDVTSVIARIEGQVRIVLPRRGVLPHWDAETGQLMVGTSVVRQVSRQAHSLRPILAAFQELGWSRRIDSPFSERDFQRLHKAIRSLNDGLRQIRFHADGSAQGIVWEWSDAE